MDIYAKKGHKVIVTEQGMRNGWKSDEENVAKHLKVDGIYTVERTEVSSWSTAVYLQEIPGVRFNSVHFEDYNDGTTRCIAVPGH